MTTKELMVGDWVLMDMNYLEEDPMYTKTDYKPYKIQNGEDIDLACETNCIGDGDVYRPIPLTPEILEKNGFKFGYTASEEDFCNAVGCGYPEEKGWCYDEGAGEIKIIFPNETDGGLIRLDDQCADKHLELVFVKPIMVHQLQQALRICGIGKEIEL